MFEVETLNFSVYEIDQEILREYGQKILFNLIILNHKYYSLILIYNSGSLRIASMKSIPRFNV